MIGCGAIGGPVALALHEERIPGCALGGILTRSAPPAPLAERSIASIEDLVDRCELIVEAAGQGAVAELGPAVVESGRDLLILSVGALVDEALWRRVSHGPGRVLLSTGAIGGFDTLVAAELMEHLDGVTLVSRKPARTLVRPWMAGEVREALAVGAEEVDVFDGPAREAVRLFPESANVAATLALATVGFDRLQMRIVGIPDASEVVHEIQAEGRAGSYSFVFRNRTADGNPRTSAITPFSVIRALSRMREPIVCGI